jgi:hypothetical protein
MKIQLCASILCAVSVLPIGASAAPSDMSGADPMSRNEAGSITGIGSDDHGRGTESERVAGIGRSDGNADDHIRAIRSVIGGLTESALENDIEDYVEYLARDDRERIEDAIDSGTDDDFGRLTQTIQTSWNQRFANQPNRLSFDLEDEDLDRVVNFPFTLSADRRSATVQLPGRGGSMGPTLRLVQEGALANRWRIDVPDTLTGEQLKRELRRHMEMANSSSGSWPSDQDSAMRELVVHLLEPLANATSQTS